MRRVFARRARSFNGWFYDAFLNPDPVDVAVEDWDNLIILDGCRYDTFAEVISLEGTLETRYSPGSSTGEFLESSFGTGTHYDIVYVTANPHLQLVSEAFYNVIDLVHDPEFWDESLHTVTPDTVVSETKKAYEAHLDKRLIVHFIQPHYPFIGPTADRLPTNPGIVGHVHKDPDRPTAHGLWKEIAKHDPTNVWHELHRYGPEVHDLVREAYRENLEIVLESVDTLLDVLDGRTVVTADHGNMLGERLFPIPVRGYGHPSGLHVPQLTKVPWFVIEGDQRRETVAEEPVQREDPDPEVVKRRLESLGYMDE